MSRSRVYFFASIGLIVILALLYNKVIWGGEAFYYRDIARGYLPEKVFQAECVKSGYWPFWNPAIFSGLAHHATLAAELYYPLNVLFWIKPYYSSFSWNIILHFFLGGLGVVFLLRSHSFPPVIVIMAACVWPLLGMNISQLEFFPIVASVAYIPWILGCFQNAAKYPFLQSLHWLGWASLGLGVQLLVNYPTISIYTIFLEFCFLAIRPREQILRSFAGIFVVGLIGSLIFGIQLLPTRELSLLSLRANGLSYELACQVPLHWKVCENILIPKSIKSLDFFLYIGPVLFIGVLMAVKQSKMKVILAGVIFWLLAALGPSTPLHKILYNYVPLFAYERKPINYCLIVSFLLFFLAVEGWKSFSANKSDSRKIPTNLVFFSGVFFFTFSSILILLKVDILTGLCSGLTTEKSINEVVRIYLQFANSLIAYSWRFTLIGGSMALWRAWPRRRVGQVIIIGFGLIDPISTLGRINPTINDSFFKSVPPLGQTILEEKSNNRCFITGDDYEKIVVHYYFKTLKPDLKILNEWKNTLEPRFPMTLGILDARGNGSILPDRYLKLVDTWDALYSSKETLNLRLLQAVGVKYLLSNLQHDSNELSLLASGPISLWKLKETLPMAGIMFEREVFPDSDSAQVLRLNDPKFPIFKRILLPSDFEGQPHEVGSASVLIVPDSNPNRVEIHYESTADGILFLCTQLYPGWKAFLDKNPIPIGAGNGWMNVVFAPSGKHSVVFQFFPEKFYIGVMITITGLLIASILIFSKHRYCLKS